MDHLNVYGHVLWWQWTPDSYKPIRKISATVVVVIRAIINNLWIGLNSSVSIWGRRQLWNNEEALCTDTRKIYSESDTRKEKPGSLATRVPMRPAHAQALGSELFFLVLQQRDLPSLAFSFPFPSFSFLFPFLFLAKLEFPIVKKGPWASLSVW